MDLMLRLALKIDAFNERIGKAAAWLGLLAVIVCSVNAIVRYAFNASSNAWLELQWYLNAGVFMLAAAWTLSRNEHIRIDVLSGKLSLRAQAWIDIVGGLLFLIPIAVIIAWYSWPSLANSYELSEYSSDPGGLLRWPIRLVIPVAFVLLILQGLAEVVKRFAFLRGMIPFPQGRKHEVT